MNRFRLIEVNRRSIGVARTERGFYALRNTCPHRGAPVCAGRIRGTMLPSMPDEFVYDADARVVRCIAHGWEFDVATGEAVFGVASKRVVTYEVEVDGDQVFVLA